MQQSIFKESHAIFKIVAKNAIFLHYSFTEGEEESFAALPIL